MQIHTFTKFCVETDAFFYLISDNTGQSLYLLVSIVPFWIFRFQSFSLFLSQETESFPGFNFQPSGCCFLPFSFFVPKRIWVSLLGNCSMFFFVCHLNSTLKTLTDIKFFPFFTFFIFHFLDEVFI